MTDMAAMFVSMAIIFIVSLVATVGGVLFVLLVLDLINKRSK